MNNSEVHKSLIEIEDNLQKLESARKQVDKVSTKSEQMTEAFVKILKQVENLEYDFERKNGYLTKALDKNIEAFSLSLANKSEVFEKKADEQNERMVNIIDDTAKKILQLHSTIESENKTFSDGVLVSVQTVNSELQNESKGFIENSQRLNRTFSDSINGFVNKLNEIHVKAEKDRNEFNDEIKTDFEKFNSVLDANSKEFAGNIKKIEEEYSASIESTKKELGRFDKCIADAIVKIQGLDVEHNFDSLKKLLGEILITITQINSKNDNIVGILNGYEIPRKFDIINENFETQNKQLKIIKTLVFSIAGMIGLVGLGLLIVLSKTFGIM